MYPATLPEQTLLVSNWHYPDYLSRLSEGDTTLNRDHFADLEKLARIMREYRQNTILLSPVHLAQYTFAEDGSVEQISLDSLRKTIAVFSENMDLKLITGSHIAKRGGRWSEPFHLIVPRRKASGATAYEFQRIQDKQTIAFYDLFLDSLAAFITEHGWRDKYAQHIADEPMAENAANYIEIAQYVRQKMPGIRIIEATHTETITPYVDIVVPQLDHLHKNHAYFSDQQSQRKEVWFYTCLNPQGRYANRHIRQPLLKTRLLHWINYRYDLKGYLHWGYNYWLSSIPPLETTGLQSSGKVLPGGDSWIVYPDNGEIVPSIRLEAMRDGIVDYELLRLAAKKEPVMVQQIVDEIIFDHENYESNIVKFR